MRLPCKVYAGTGCITTRATIRQSLRAKAMGADALSIVTLYFAKASQEELFQHYLDVAAAVDMPIVLYDIPARAGNDSLILWTLMAGGTGGIAGCANVFPKNMAALYEKFQAGDIEGARACQDAIRPLRDCFKYSNPNAIIKAAVALLGYPVGKCRAPFNLVPPEGVAAIRKVLDDAKAQGIQ